jgi:hypothetical protein
MRIWPVADVLQAIRSESKDYCFSWVFQARGMNGPSVTFAEQMQKDDLASPRSRYREFTRY